MCLREKRGEKMEKLERRMHPGSCFARVIGQGLSCWLVECNRLLASGFGGGTGGSLSSRYRGKPVTKARNRRATRAKVRLRGIVRTADNLRFPFPRGGGILGKEVNI